MNTEPQALTQTMKKIFIAIFASIISLTAVAGNAKDKIGDTDKNLINASKRGWTMRLSAGYNIGGTAPLPLPVEIRGIEVVNPGETLTLQGSAEKMSGKFGIRFVVKC